MTRQTKIRTINKMKFSLMGIIIELMNALHYFGAYLYNY